MPLHNDLPLAGVIGLGLMGRSIVACLLASGHEVVGVTNDLAASADVPERVRVLLEEMRDEGLFQGDVQQTLDRLQVVEGMAKLAGAGLVVESVTEDLNLKRQLLLQAEEAVPEDCILASNTSALPVSLLQEPLVHPERVLGIHWAEPAHVTRFLEIIRGPRTETIYVERAAAWAERWGKQPSILQKEIRGFITNRIAYAMFREACHLVESGVCTVQDVDRSLRNDVGWWIPFAGPFRYMDLTGVEAYHRVMGDLLPELSTEPGIPKIIDDLVKSGGRGVSNGRGFYEYTEEESEEWERRFLEFNYKIRKLTSEYSDLAQ